MTLKIFHSVMLTKRKMFLNIFIKYFILLYCKIYLFTRKKEVIFGRKKETGKTKNRRYYKEEKLPCFH